MRVFRRNKAGLTGFLGLILALAAAAAARADTLVSGFAASECVQGRYGSWEDAEPVQQEGRWSITARGFGGAFRNLVPPYVDARAEALIELTVAVESVTGDPAAVVAGPLVVLEDAEGNQAVWAWYGRGLGRHVLTAKLSGPSFTKPAGSARGLDFSRLVAFHIQVDPGQSTAAYKITFEKLRFLAGEPPPAS